MLTDKWRKSPYSNPNGNSVEARQLEDGRVEFRESDTPDRTAVTSAHRWNLFVDGVAANPGSFRAAE
jgi:hypothetical protein